MHPDYDNIERLFQFNLGKDTVEPLFHSLFDQKKCETIPGYMDLAWTKFFSSILDFL